MGDNHYKVIVCEISEDDMRIVHNERDIISKEDAKAFADHWTKQPEEDNRCNQRCIAFVTFDLPEDEFGLVFFMSRQMFISIHIMGAEWLGEVNA